MENVGIFYGDLEYFMFISYILWPFCNLVVIWYTFSPLWYTYYGKYVILRVCLHEQCFSVLDATAASDTAQKIGLFLSLDAAVASNTEKHCSCKQTIRSASFASGIGNRVMFYLRTRLRTYGQFVICICLPRLTGSA
jgi:hypothetical protein